MIETLLEQGTKDLETVSKQTAVSTALTDDDLLAQLRQHGIVDLHTVRYVLYEAKGGLTIVPEQDKDGDGDLVVAGLRSSAGFPTVR